MSAPRSADLHDDGPGFSSARRFAATSGVSNSKLKPLAIAVPALSRDIAVIFRERLVLDTPSRDLIRQIETIGTDLSRERSQG